MSAITLFEEKQVRRAWNAAEEKWYFSITDVVAILTDSVDPNAYWRKLKERLKKEGNETVTNCHGLKMTAADGKQRMTDVAQLIFTMLGEASTTEIAKKRDAQGFPANRKASKAGGTIAGNARRALEIESGTQVSTRRNFKALPEAQAKKLSKHPQP